MGSLSGQKKWVLHQQQGLVNKSVRWVPIKKLLSDDQMVEQVWTFQALTDLVWRAGSPSWTGFMHTPATMQQSNQWLESGVPGLEKAKKRSIPSGKRQVFGIF
jgi:hypothetical protein